MKHPGTNETLDDSLICDVKIDPNSGTFVGYIMANFLAFYFAPIIIVTLLYFK